MVGTGFASQCHVECLHRVSGVNVEITGVTSLRAESRESFGRKHSIPVYDDIAAMLPHIDVLDICSPASAHEEGIRWAMAAGKAVICEKPFTGYFGPNQADESYRGDKDTKVKMLKETVERMQRLATVIQQSNAIFCYAENFVYAPSLQKEREIVEKTGAQILRMTGEESHNGSASDVYGIWRFAGGGSLIGKGCHPLSAMLYLKRIEGLARNGQPIRPARVTARTHQITRLPEYRDAGFIRTDYHDVEDCGMMHVIFEDGTLCDVLTSELVLGGIYDYVEVFANNHRTRCRISPTGLVDTFNPRGENYRDIYLCEKTSTQEGWSTAAPDEHYTMGYLAEIQDFVTSIARGIQPQSSLPLALDTITTIYAAYLSDERRGAEVDIPLI